jgi:predicted metal-dependent phosphoesterase TrpH
MRVILGKLNDELLLNLATSAASFCSEVEAAVAYAESKDHPLLQTCKQKGIKLTFFGLLDEEGAVSPMLLRELLSWGPSRAEARLVKGNFHAKVIWWRGYGAYVGSANLTHKAWFNNVEAGIFFEEAELVATGVGAELDHMFVHLATNSISVTTEVVEKLERLAQDRRPLTEQRAKLKTKFDQLFGHLPDNPGLTVKPPKGHEENKALKKFAAEWMQTLQLMRGLSKEFAELGARPKWVDADAHPSLHFDQFLHAYYYDYVRGGVGVDEDEDLSGMEKVEASFAKNSTNPSSALKQAARWWASLPSDGHSEEQFIRETAPAMRAGLTKEAIRSMDLAAFREAFRHVNAFRMHARQVKNVELGLPAGYHESHEERVTRLCNWLWRQTTASGKTVRDVLEFVLWGASPSDMEQRLWLGVWADEYRLPHFGQSSLGEAVGWARPDDYPPRNNRTNKALRALGHNVKLFSKG